MNDECDSQSSLLEIGLLAMGRGPLAATGISGFQ
jgi:hypothetical protein